MTSKTTRGSKGLYAPPSYWQANKVHLRSQLNGCGPSSWPSWVVPDSLVGLDISESCNIHDWMYYKSQSTNDYKNADEVFLENMKTQIDNKPESKASFRKIIRYAFSYLYFSGVRIYSSLKNLFKIGKQQNEEK